MVVHFTYLRFWNIFLPELYNVFSILGLKDYGYNSLACKSKLKEISTVGFQHRTLFHYFFTISIPMPLIEVVFLNVRFTIPDFFIFRNIIRFAQEPSFL